MGLWRGLISRKLMGFARSFLYLCVSSLLVVDLLGLWRGVKPRKLVTWQGPLAWRKTP